MILIPANGVDYRTSKDVMKDWTSGKDFIISDISAGKDNNRYCSIRDFSEADEITIRYSHLQNFVLTHGQIEAPRPTSEPSQTAKGNLMPRKITPAAALTPAAVPMERVGEPRANLRQAIARVGLPQRVPEPTPTMPLNAETRDAIVHLLSHDPTLRDDVLKALNGPKPKDEKVRKPMFDLITIEKWAGKLSPQQRIVVRPDKGAEAKLSLRVCETINENLEAFHAFMAEVKDLGEAGPDDEKALDGTIAEVNDEYLPLSVRKRLLQMS